MTTGAAYVSLHYERPRFSNGGLLLLIQGDSAGFNMMSKSGSHDNSDDEHASLRGVFLHIISISF